MKKSVLKSIIIAILAFVMIASFAGCDYLVDILPDSISGIISGNQSDKTPDNQDQGSTTPDDPTHVHTIVVDEAVAPTCTATGLTEGKHCSVCNKVLVAQTTTAKIAHIKSNWIIDKAATTTENGLKHTECTMCGKKMSEETIPATGSVGLAYTVNSDNKSCTITGIGDCTDSHVIIPTAIDGYTVTTISNRAFYNCTSITEITIPASVSSIGTQIFYKASNLATVYYNGTYGSQENQFLNLSHITKIVFGGSYVPRYVCYKNTSVKTVEILDGVTRIGYNSFEGCSSLTSVTIGDSVTSIDEYAFYNCTSLTSVTIGDSVTSIGEYAFYNCTSLTSVTIGDSVTSIGEYAFYDCTSLTSVTIGDSVKSIGRYAFYGCESLTSVYITDINAWFGISFKYASNPMTNGANLYLNGELVADVTIPDTITNWAYTFAGCTSIVSVTIPDSVTSIGEYAFSGCEGLTSITIPDSVTNIGGCAFSGCGLTSITIPDSITSIGYREFAWCKSLTSVTIPNSVTEISSEAFAYCESLTSVTIPDSVMSISSMTFYHCESLTSITIPDGVTSIGSSAFNGCTGLTTIMIPDGVTSIGGSAFEDCNMLIAKENGVYYVDKWVVGHDSSIVAVSIRADTVGLAYGVFQNCYVLQGINFEGTVEQWNAIYKDFWISNAPATEVVCSNGTVKLK